jgi:hypothetical protein
VHGVRTVLKCSKCPDLASIHTVAAMADGQTVRVVSARMDLLGQRNATRVVATNS